jgi:hypothetical protein
MRTTCVALVLVVAAATARAERPLQFLDEEQPAPKLPDPEPRTRPLYEVMVPGILTLALSQVAPIIYAAVAPEGFVDLALIPLVGPFFSAGNQYFAGFAVAGQIVGTIMWVVGACKRVPIPIEIGAAPTRDGATTSMLLRF